MFEAPGIIAGLVLAAFFEWTRRTMRRPERNPDAYNDNAQYAAALEYNQRLRNAKAFAFGVAIAIAVTYMWCNGQTFYQHIARHGDLAQRIAFGEITYADFAARWFAGLMSAIGYLSLRGLSLTRNVQAAA